MSHFILFLFNSEANSSLALSRILKFLSITHQTFIYQSLTNQLASLTNDHHSGLL
jgi:hypothetical protein